MTYNHNTFRRILVCATAAALLCTGFAGCSDSNSSDSESGVNIAMEDLEYGATMRDDDSRAVPLEYDKRFLEDGELDALANYYASIQNEDVELFQSCTVEKYMESSMKTPTADCWTTTPMSPSRRKAMKSSLAVTFTSRRFW